MAPIGKPTSTCAGGGTDVTAQYVIHAPGGAMLVPLSGGGTGNDPTKEVLTAFGADPTGVTPSDTAVTAWLAAIIASGKPGYVPSGKYLIASVIAATFLRDTRIAGAGAGLSRFVCNPGARFDFTVAPNLAQVDAAGAPLFQQHRLMVEGLSFITRGDGGDDALTVTYPFSQSITDRGFIARNLQFRGEDQATQCWRRGIKGVRLWNPLISDVNFKGRQENVYPFTSQAGVELVEPQAPRIFDYNCYHAEAALHVHGDRYCEGLNVSHFEWVGVRRGIVLGGTPVKAAGTTIHHGHVNAYERGVVASNVRMLNISDILFLKAPWTGYWQGVEVLNSEGLSIHHNRFRGNPGSPGGNDCVSLGASFRCSMSNNDGGDFASPGAICVMYGGSNHNDAFDNMRGTNCSTVALLDGQLSNRTQNT